MDTSMLRASWARVAAAGDLAAKYFYATLFVLAPETRAMFPASMTAQNDKLLAALGHIVSNVDDAELMGRFTTRLGADHRRFAVEPHHYGLVGQALLATLARFLGGAWTVELQRDWETAYRAVSGLMLAGAAEAARTTPPWWTCKVVETDRRTAEILVFTVLPDYQLEYRAGQSLPVQGPRADGWRYLSPANAPRQDGTIEFHVRAVGVVSTGLVRHLQPGDTVQLGVPTGVGLADCGDPSTGLVMIAGGTGVAPMRAVLDELTRKGPRPTTLVYGAPTQIGLYDHRPLTALAARTPWLTYIPTVQLGHHWRGSTGVAVDVALASTDCHDRDIMVCGSPDMVHASVATLRRNGVPDRRIHIEQHTNSIYPPLPHIGRVAL